MSVVQTGNKCSCTFESVKCTGRICSSNVAPVPFTSADCFLLLCGFNVSQHRPFSCLCLARNKEAFVRAWRLGLRRENSPVHPVLPSVVTKLRTTLAVFQLCCAHLYPSSYCPCLYLQVSTGHVVASPFGRQLCSPLSCVPVKAASHSRKPKLLCSVYLLYI